ncbi:MAG: iron transporter [Planctomycetes bacterium]|jgi:Mn2+/Fe2+ NRAMP family transporter|nr:iron transporter [Planctomycetota bacterium]MDP6409906.1 Nramp family divalent metal transporter [Planctomycetota bacterium]
MSRRSPSTILRALGPGLLVAATGVGAGDLATGAISGSLLGTTVLWAGLIGAAFKFVLSEGLTRWQLATGETLLEGALTRLARPARFLFLLYLLPWTFFVGGSLVSGCGVTAHAIAPICATPEQGKVFFGALHSVLGLILVLRGGYALFSKLMSACIGFMVVTVVVTAILLRPDWGAVATGSFVPSIPAGGGDGIAWTVALIGGVGGTLTILCYGYWIRESGRTSPDDLGLCRLDLLSGYLMTAVFCVAMVIIGSTIEVQGSGAGLIVTLADRLEEPLGLAGRWAFLIGAWGAVFSSLLGVWQAVPYVFADFWRLRNVEPGAGATGCEAVDVNSTPYRAYLCAIAFVPLLGLAIEFKAMQKTYAIVGAMFVPLLAVCLLVLNSRAKWIGARHTNRPLTVVVLIGILVFFVCAGWLKLTH